MRAVAPAKRSGLAPPTPAWPPRHLRRSDLTPWRARHSILPQPPRQAPKTLPRSAREPARAAIHSCAAWAAAHARRGVHMRASTVRSTLLVLAIIGLCTRAADAGTREQPAAAGPMRLAIAGLVHGHVRGFLRALERAHRCAARRHRRARCRRSGRAVLQQHGLAAVDRVRVGGRNARSHPPRSGGHVHPHVGSPCGRRGERPPARAGHDGEAARGERRRRRADPPRGGQRRAFRSSSTTKRRGTRASWRPGR